MGAAPVLRTEFVNRYEEGLPYRSCERDGRALHDVLKFYSPRGPLRKLVTYFGHAGSSPVQVGHTEYADFDYVLKRLSGLPSLNTGLRDTLFAGGKGAHLPGMFLSSIGEAVERILGAMGVNETTHEIVFGSARSLSAQGLNVLHPEELPLFAEEQYQSGDLVFERFTDESFLGWIRGRHLIGGGERWVPAQLVSLVYFLQRQEAMIGYATSGGLSCHVSERAALFHGITELIERDAVNLRWNCKLAPERLELDVTPRYAPLRRLLDQMSGCPAMCDFYQHTVDIPEVPVICAIQRVPWYTRWSYYSGGGVNVNVEHAMLQALTEYGQAERSLGLGIVAPDRQLSQNIRRIFDVGEDIEVSKINIFFKIIAYYGYEKNFAKMKWFVDGPGRVPLSSLPAPPCGDVDDAYDRLIEVLRKHRLDPIVFDFTPAQLPNIRLMKVIIPELAPPYLHSMPVLGHPRYYQMPKRMGVADRALTYADLVTDPLPYP